MKLTLIPRIVRFAAGSGLSLCVLLTASANTIVTFQVDMSAAAFDPGTQTVSARGSFNGWNSFPLTNNPLGPNPGVWSGTTNLPLNGSVMQYKYTIEPGATYETVFLAGNHNRLIALPAANGTLTLPQVFFNDAPTTPVTVQVTFQVNLAQQINVGAFDTNTSTAQARGIFNGWGGTAIAQTNDPTILTTNQFGLVNSNVYVATYEITGSPGQTIDYKYFIDTGANWESPPPGTGDPQDNNNRFFNLGAGAAQSLPIVYFNDAPYSPVATNAVTFQVDMSAQVLDGNFDPASGAVELRGNFNSWGGTQILCTNDIAHTNLYVAVVPLSGGVGSFNQYKFWSGNVPVNGGWETMADNRTMQIVAGTAQTIAPVYFSNESPSLGSIQIEPPSGGTVFVSWTPKLGAPGEYLQTTTSLVGGSWTSHPETVGLSSTNFPISAGQAVFFRLKSP